MLGKKTSTTSTASQPVSIQKNSISNKSHLLHQKTTSKFHKKDISNYSQINIEDEKMVESALKIVHPLVIKNIDVSETSKMSADELIIHLRPIVGKILNDERIQLNAKEQNYLEMRLVDDMIGLGPLEYLLIDDSISDILVNSTKNIYVERNGLLEKSHISFRDEDHILNVISRIVSTIGRRVDETNPYVDARLADGSRVNAIIPPLAIDGPCLSIRKFKRQSMTLETLTSNGMLSQSMLTFLSVAVKCKLNIIILGGAGSGKTTLLNALSQYIPSTERIITIEDSAELQLQQPHVVRLETRSANIEGTGAITERQLVKNALRMRPDRIILGEIRGEEAFDLLQAMNTGHDGSMSSIHASSTKEVAARLSNMVMMAGYRLPVEAVFKQVADSISLLIHTNRMRDGKRRIVNISEVIGIEGQEVILQEIFKFQMLGENEHGILGNFIYTHVTPKLFETSKLYGLNEELKKSYESIS